MPPAQQALYESHTAQGGAILEKSGSSDQAVLAIVNGHHNLIAQVGQTGATLAAHQESIRLVGVIDQYDELVTVQWIHAESPNQIRHTLRKLFISSVSLVEL